MDARMTGRSAIELVTQPILPRESFLRKLPQVLHAEQRIRLEALVYISDALTWAFRNVVEGAKRYALRPAEMSDNDRAELFASVWSIVDNLDAARQIIATISDERPGPKTSALLQDLEKIRGLRNDMDHLNQKVRNLARSKGFSAPIYGALSFFHIPREMIRETPAGATVTGGQSITIAAGSMGGSHLVPLVMPRGRAMAPPVDLFTFSAFKHEIELGPLLVQFGDWLRVNARTIEANLRDQLGEHARATGKTMDELLAPLPFGLFISADIRFDEAGEPSPPTSPLDADP